MQLPLTSRHIDTLIVLLLFFNLPVDMVNGILLQGGVALPMSISQLYKLLVLGIMLFRIILFPGVSILIIGFAYFILFFSSIVQAVYIGDSSFLLDDFIKVSRYLTPFIAFFYFRGLFKKNPKKIILYLFYWIYFSYIVLAVNVLVKLIGLGYPMYDAGEIGTRGFFFAGNEISAILLVLSSIIAYNIWYIKKSKFFYVCFLVLNVFLSILITSKTAVLGILIIFFLIAFDYRKIKLRFQTLVGILISITVLIPAILYFAYTMILSSTIMIRLVYFWGKLDFVTFIFSSRNIFVKKMWIFYVEDYTLVQKIIGAGQTFYESKLGTIVEIDLLDIFFAYGILGAIIFCFVVAALLIKAYMLKSNNLSPFGRLSYLMIIILTIISLFAGHVYSSGIGGFYIGFIFAIMYYRKNG